MSKAIFFDLSSLITGYAIYEDEKLIKSGKISPPGKKAKDRYLEMMDSILGLVDTTSPDLVVSESVYTGKCITSIEYPLKIHGTLDYFCRDISYAEISPCSWRAAIGLKLKPEEKITPEGEKLSASKRRKLLKLKSIEMASIYALKKIDNDDEADAINIGRAYFIKTNKNK